MVGRLLILCGWEVTSMAWSLTAGDALVIVAIVAATVLVLVFWKDGE